MILAAWAANAVCETIRCLTGLQARIKWPNDVQVRGRKVCGILIEQKAGVRGQEPGVRGQGSGVRAQESEVREESLAAYSLTPDPRPLTPDFTVVGIGLNVNQTAESLEAAGLPQAGSLACFTGGPLECRGMARELIKQLDEEYERLCQGDLATLEARWQWRTGLLGQHVLMECQDASHRGRLRELTWDGLILEQTGGEALHLPAQGASHRERARRRRTRRPRATRTRRIGSNSNQWAVGSGQWAVVSDQ